MINISTLLYLFRQKHKQPIPTNFVIGICMVIIILLALATGYFQSGWDSEEKKYLRLEDKFVRVRDQLGREETQRLIDESYR